MWYDIHTHQLCQSKLTSSRTKSTQNLWLCVVWCILSNFDFQFRDMPPAAWRSTCDEACDLYWTYEPWATSPLCLLALQFLIIFFLWFLVCRSLFRSPSLPLQRFAPMAHTCNLPIGNLFIAFRHRVSLQYNTRQQPLIFDVVIFIEWCCYRSDADTVQRQRYSSLFRKPLGVI